MENEKAMVQSLQKANLYDWRYLKEDGTRMEGKWIGYDNYLARIPSNLYFEFDLKTRGSSKLIILTFNQTR